MEWLLIALLGAGAGGAGWLARTAARERRAAREFERDRARLPRWAKQHGWTLTTAGDGRIADAAARIIALAEELPAGAGAPASSPRPAEILTRQTAEGRLLLIGYESRRDGATCVAALTTRATIRPYLLDTQSLFQARAEIGEAPRREDGRPLSTLLDGLHAGSRLRLVADVILIRSAGRLAPRMADELAGRLAAIERALPRMPLLGPHR